MNDDIFESMGREAKPARQRGDGVPGFKDWDGGLITAPGAYRDIPNKRYHGVEICDSPSISGTGLKILAADKGQRDKGKTPRHFFETSHLNPNRKEKKRTDALKIGGAFHDCLLLPEVWESSYHVTQPGFSKAATTKFAAEIAAAAKAEANGFDVLTSGQCDLIVAMAEAMLADPLIGGLLQHGEAEVTFAWKDAETGVWLRARPDWMLPDRSIGLNIKTDTSAAYSDFSRSIAKYGYAQAAALELDGYQAIFGEAPRKYFHPVIEKPTPADFEPGDFMATALWELPAEDIERGRWLNRMAIRTFAECLSSGKWPSYTPEPEPCGLPSWARHVIDGGGASEEPDDEINAGEGE